MKWKISILVLVTLILMISNLAYCWNYPRDGKFKQLSPHHDSWFFTDQRWDIKAPDKWQHFTGSYFSQKILSRYMNKYLSAGILFSFGILKECEDAYREGYSGRDVLANLIGIASATFENRKYRILCLYDQEKLTLNLYVNINL